MPLQRSAQPSADSKRLRPIQQIFLRNLGAKTRERAKNLQPAACHHKQRNGIDPVTNPHRQRMLIYRTSNGLRLFALRLRNFDDASAHVSSRFPVSKFPVSRPLKLETLKLYKP